ncbi:MAG: helix-turn-helix domain-containing protein [Oscillospiraceae bacterium]|nr:helix-turn-helix domain-containing protein [Oscillospiraceae bacterium]
MKIIIGENIKRERRTRDLTQEELAERLGVSTQSVSRWERGDCYPDLELIPAIARFFEMTVDDLLGVDALTDEERLWEVVYRQRELQQEGVPQLSDEEATKAFEAWLETGYNPPEAMERTRLASEKASAYLSEMARDYPNNWKIQELYASDYLSIRTWDTPEDIVRRHEKCVELYERVIEKCPQEETRWSAIESLAFMYSIDDKMDLAIATAKRLPEHLQGHSLERYYIGREEGPQYTQSRMQSHAIALYNTVENLIPAECAMGVGSAEEHLDKFLFCRSVMKKVIPHYGERVKEGDVQRANIFHLGALHLLEHGDAERALDYIEISAEAFAEIVDFYEARDGKRKLSAETYLVNFREKAFDPIREHPRFVAAMNRIRGL